MAFVVTKDIETGNKKLDNDHVELFAKINDFMDSCAQGKGTAEIMVTVDYLRKYTVTHFSYEENLQKSNNYHNYTQHKAFHDKFTKSLEDIVKEIQSVGVSPALVGKINIHLGSALIAHIKTADVELAQFLKDKN